jgi:hypothetical protein
VATTRPARSAIAGPRQVSRHSPGGFGWHPKSCSSVDLWSIGSDIHRMADPLGEIAPQGGPRHGRAVAMSPCRRRSAPPPAFHRPRQPPLSERTARNPEAGKRLNRAIFDGSHKITFATFAALAEYFSS